MPLDTRCPWCGLLVQTTHENDAACVAALKAAVTDARRVSSTCEVVRLDRPRVRDTVADADEQGSRERPQATRAETVESSLPASTSIGNIRGEHRRVVKVRRRATTSLFHYADIIQDQPPLGVW